MVYYNIQEIKIKLKFRQNRMSQGCAKQAQFSKNVRQLVPDASITYNLDFSGQTFMSTSPLPDSAGKTVVILKSTHSLHACAFIISLLCSHC